MIQEADLSSSSSSSSSAGPVLPFPHLKDGAVILGCPVGNRNFVDTKCEEMLRDSRRCLDKLHELALPAAVAFKLVKASINARPHYMTRVLGKVSFPHVTGFDQSVDNVLVRLSGGPENTHILEGFTATIRSLPPDLGGLGVPRHSWLHGQKGALQTRDRVESFFNNHFPTLDYPTFAPLCIGEADPLGIFSVCDPETDIATRDEALGKRPVVCGPRGVRVQTHLRCPSGADGLHPPQRGGRMVPQPSLPRLRKMADDRR